MSLFLINEVLLLIKKKNRHVHGISTLIPGTCVLMWIPKLVLTGIFFFFFLISKDDIYMKGYSMHEEHRANLENTRIGKQRKI